MGYRTYIGSMPKKEYDKIKSLDLTGIFNFYKRRKKLTDLKDFYIGVYDYGTELYEFGKYTDFKPPTGSMKVFFKRKSVMKRYSDYELYVVDKTFLKYIIGYYNEKIKSYYKSLFDPFLEKDEEFVKSIKEDYSFQDTKYKFDFSKITDSQQTAIKKLIDHVRDNKIEWESDLVFDLDSGEAITKSWKYEYGIFELIRIYKSFDWEKNVMIYYGY